MTQSLKEYLDKHYPEFYYSTFAGKVLDASALTEKLNFFNINDAEVINEAITYVANKQSLVE